MLKRFLFCLCLCSAVTLGGCASDDENEMTAKRDPAADGAAPVAGADEPAAKPGPSSWFGH